MKSFVDAVRGAQAVSKKKEKFVALGNLTYDGKRLMVEALSNFRVFGVKKFDMPEQYSAVDNEPNLFFNLLDKLESRALTGNAARAAIQSTLAEYTQETAEILARVLLKDLKAGFSADTLNKLYPGLVKTFDIMLAKKVDESYVWEFPCLVEAKYNGERNIGFSDNHVIDYRSRSGIEATHCKGLFDEEMKRLEDYFGFPLVVDAERYAGSYKTTQHAKKSTNTEAKGEMRLYAFDYNSIEGWNEKKCTMTQRNRREILRKALAETKCEKIQLTEGKIVNNYEEARAYYDEVLAQGFEGLVIKKLDGMYEWDRSNNWWKWKPVMDLDGTIVGIYKGRPGSKYENTCGGIDLEGEDENGTKFTCSCGSGLSDKMRDDIINHPENYLGKTAQIEAQEFTTSAGSDVASVWFPVFIKIRTDK